MYLNSKNCTLDFIEVFSKDNFDNRQKLIQFIRVICEGGERGRFAVLKALKSLKCLGSYTVICSSTEFGSVNLSYRISYNISSSPFTTCKQNYSRSIKSISGTGSVHVYFTHPTQ
jgi:hypothetical protein